MRALGGVAEPIFGESSKYAAINCLREGIKEHGIFRIADPPKGASSVAEKMLTKCYIFHKKELHFVAQKQPDFG